MTKVITAAKRIHLKEIIHKSDNKIKSTWKIINDERENHKKKPQIQFLKNENKIMNKQEDTANIFNDYFLSVAKLLNKDNKDSIRNIDPIFYLQNHMTSFTTKSHGNRSIQRKWRK